MKLNVTVNGQKYEVDVEVAEEDFPALPPVIIGGGTTGNTPSAPTTASVSASSVNAIVAPLAGSVARINVKEGDSIEAGQVVVVLEAMKMETEITAPAAGTVAEIFVAPGDAVQGGQGLLRVE